MTRLLLICALLITCNAQQLEKDFFRKHPRTARLESMRHYGLEDQYKIYRYGQDKIEPPEFDLAEPIAERGKAAIPFLTEQLRSDKDDLTVRDILYVLEQMLQMKTFDLRQDASLMEILQSRVLAIKNQNVQHSSREILAEIKNAPQH